MAMPEPGELRSSDRKRVLKGAKIAFANRCSALPCVVRDISSTGARLQVKDHASVPDTFELLIELDGFEADALVVWRDEGEVGVAFLSEPTIVKPTRTQVVTSYGHMRKGTLRRQKTPRPELKRNMPLQAPGAPEEPAQTLDVPAQAEDVHEAPDAHDATPATIAPHPHADEPIVEGQVHPADVTQEEPHVPSVEGPSTEIAEPADETFSTDEDVQSPEETKLDDSQQDVAAESNDEMLKPAEDVSDQEPVEQSVDGSSIDDTPCVTGVLQEDETSLDVVAPDATEIVEAPIDMKTDTLEQQDSILMDQANADVSSLAATDVDIEDESVTQEPVAPLAPRDEVPMFRDQLPSAAPALASAPATTAATASVAPESTATAADPAVTSEPPVLIDQDSLEDTVAHFQDPFRSHVKAAFQAPQHAADNMVGREMPVIPAAVAESEPADIPDRVVEEAVEALVRQANLESAIEAPVVEASTVATAVTETVAPETADKKEPAEPEADVTVADEFSPQMTDVTDPVVEPETTTEVPATQPELRPDLADFISNFKAIEISQAVTPQESGAGEVENSSPEFNVEELDTNVVTLAEHTGQPEASTPVDLEIIDDIIVIDDSSDPVTMFDAVPVVVEPVASESEISDDSEVVKEAEVVEPVAVSVPHAPMSSEAPDNIEQVSEIPTPETKVAEESQELPVITADVETAPVVGEFVEKTEAADTPATDGKVDLDQVVPAPLPVSHRAIPILIAEDDPDDRMFMREAFGESDFDHDIAFVENGEELLEYLNGDGDFADRARPELILLDLNMPKMDGRTALLHIKANPLLRRIPIIILTTSKSEDDIEKTYDLGVSSYISKPSSAEGLKEVITTLNVYWSNLCALPAAR